MKTLIQRVTEARVDVDGKTVGVIEHGILAFLGIHSSDTDKEVAYHVKKLHDLRIFSDENEKMNLSVQDCRGKILLVSQFTLCGNCEKGRRPSFIESARPEIAEPLYEAFITALKKEMGAENVQTGIFGAKMLVHLTNDGPVTFIV